MYARFALLYATILLAALLAVLGLSNPVAAEGDATSNLGALRINEFLADNETVWIDPDDPGLDEFPDWIELINTSGQAVSLNGLYITDDPAIPDKFAITDGLSIPANGYVIFYADDEEEDEGPFHLGFRLSKNGGYIGLYTGDSDSPPIDEIAYDEQASDISLGRLPDGSGPFQRLTRPSPGRSNLVTSPRISAVERDPELPTATTPVQVSAVITDDVAVVEATLLYSVNGSGPVEVPMAFNAQSQRYRGTIPPRSNGDVVEYTLRAVDGDDQITPDPTFELPYLARYVVGYNIPPIVINEVTPENQLALEDPDDPGDFPDWIEVYNTSDRTVSLDGLYFTDDMDEPTKSPLPDGLTIGPRGFAIFYADRDPEQGGYHLDFRLDRSGESVGIFGALGTVAVDTVTYGNVPSSVGYGRWPDGTGEWDFMYCATPGKANLLCDRQIYLPIINVPLVP